MKKRTSFFKYLSCSIAAFGFLASTIACGSTPTPSLKNYITNTVAPGLVPNGINYNQPKLTPYINENYAFENFLGSSKGVNFLQNINTSFASSKLISLGNITAVDPSAVQGDQSYARQTISNNLFDYANENSNAVIPSINGVFPLWTANWTDQNNLPLPSEQKDDQILNLLSKIRSEGHDYIFTIGGDGAKSLAQDSFDKKYSAEELAILYSQIIDALDLHAINFEIPIGEDFNVQKLRMDAIQILKSEKKYSNLNLQISVPSTVVGPMAYYSQMVAYGLKNNLFNVVNLEVNANDSDISVSTGNRATLPGESALYAMSAVNGFAETFSNPALTPFSRDQLFAKTGVIISPGVYPESKMASSNGKIWTFDDQALFSLYAKEHNLASIQFNVFNDFNTKLADSKLTIDPKFTHNFSNYSYNQLIDGSRQFDQFNNALCSKDGTYSDIAQIYNQNLTNFNVLYMPTSLLTLLNGLVPNYHWESSSNTLAQAVDFLTKNWVTSFDNTSSLQNGIINYISTINPIDFKGELNQEYTTWSTYFNQDPFINS